MKYQRIINKDGTVRYRSQPRDPVSGRKISIEADTLDELKERLKRVKEVKADLRWGGLDRKKALERIRPAAQTGPLTVKILWERYLKTLGAKALKLASQNWAHLLGSSFGPLSPYELSRDKMAEWEAAMVKRGYAAKTIVNAYNHLAGCFRRAIDAGTIEELPWGSIARGMGGTGWRPTVKGSRKTIQFVGTLEQFMALLDAAKRQDEKAWKKGRYSDLAVRIALDVLTGMRTAEACGLAWDCVEIDREPYLLRVIAQAGRGWQRGPGDVAGARVAPKPGMRPKEPTKGRKHLTQHLHITAVELLRTHRAELRRRGWYRFDGPVFPGNSGAWRTSGRVITPEKMKELAHECGFPRWEDWTVHSLRHSFATLEVKASGGDLKRTQLRTGHSSTKQLDAYLHATGDFLGSSAIPALPIRLDPVRMLSDGSVIGIVPVKEEYTGKDNNPELTRLAEQLLDPWGFDRVPTAPDVLAVTGTSARQYDDDRRESSRTLRTEAERPFSELAAEWLQKPSGMRNGVPEAVAAAANRHYHQAYSKEKRAGGKPKACRNAGMRKRRATLGAWARAVTIAERRLSGALDAKNTEVKLEDCPSVQ